MVNTSPLFVSGPEINFVSGASNRVLSGVTTTTTITDYNGTHANCVLVYDESTTGGFIQKLVLEAAGTNNASVLRLFINNGTANTNASANSLYMQYSLPATTASSSTATAHIEIPLMLQMPPGYKLYGLLGVAASIGVGWFVNTVGGDY